ncbi:F-box domain [Arabidopsis thaliana x Arabidopsis arenosa]|uniref:F-box domain n=1 Tax=Arabidopsis thaliana x Arabidopsis arenosa TaxID=1240361 RepID=A0A8T1Y5Z3_9BRAS|nr:F-box domain [Arabidopsis thaliana x Arabidopsis arenosa]
MSSRSRSSAATNRKDPPRKKNKQMTTEPTSIGSLPNDLLLNCFARVSRMYYPALSRVSKRFRSIVTSPEIYHTRSLLNRTEKCLYLCLRFPFDNNTHWFTLYQNPNRSVSNKSSGKVLVQIPSPEYPLTQSSNLVAVGSNIYKIGGTVGDDFSPFDWYRKPSSKVSVLDCRSHTWRDGPRMRLDRKSSTTSVVDGKIYVTGGTKDTDNASNWIEVFDPKTQSWGSVTNPRIVRLWEEESYRRVVKSIGHEGKLYLFGDDFVVYNPEEGIWNPVGEDRLIGCALKSSHCVIDNILFYWDQGVFKWYDSKVPSWKELKGVEGLPDLNDREYCKLVDLGGKMAVLWDVWRCSKSSEANMIWCAVISLEKRHGDEIWGKVEWFDSMFAVGGSCSLISADALSVSV